MAVRCLQSLGSIDNGREVLDTHSRLVENRMPNRAQVPDIPIGQHDPVLLLVFGFVAEYLRELYEHALAVQRVNQLAGLFELRRAPGAAGSPPPQQPLHHQTEHAPPPPPVGGPPARLPHTPPLAATRLT